MKQTLKIGMIVFAACFAFLSAQASTVDWQGATDNWSAAKWSIDGGAATSTYGTTISDQVSITSGSVTTAGNLVAAVGGTTVSHHLLVDDAQLTINGMLDFGSGNGNIQTLGLTMTNSAVISATYLNLKTKNLGLSDVVFAGGTLVLTDANSIRGGNFPAQNVSITAGAGEFTLTANSTAAASTLARKTSQDVFAIEGTQIVVAADGYDVSVLNTELATKVVNGKWLQITEGVGTQTLNVIPEPATISMVALCGGAMLFIRRKLMI